MLSPSRPASLSSHYFFFLLMRPPPSSTLFPYTTLFRSGAVVGGGVVICADSSSTRADSRRRSSAGSRPQLSERFSARSEEHTSELQSPCNLVCRLLLEKKKTKKICKARQQEPSQDYSSS